MDRRTDKRMRTLSLFSGIGGLDIGLQQWCRTVCYCEVNPYAIGVLIKNMVEGSLDVAPVWDNVRTLRQPQLARLGPIECVQGGFPCQDISGLGKRAGIKRGTRSGLFYELMRVVRLAQPQIVFLENVHRLLARGMDIVLRELSKSGYNALWQVLPASSLGFPHRRNRVWILAYPRGGRFDGNVVLRILARRRKKNSPVRVWDKEQFKLLAGKVAPAKWQYKGCDHPRSLFVRGDNGLPSQLDKHRLETLGNAVVPQCAALAFKTLLRQVLVEKKPKSNKLLIANYPLPRSGGS